MAPSYLEDALNVYWPPRGLCPLHSLREVYRQLVAVLNGHAAALAQVGLHRMRAVPKQRDAPLIAKEDFSGGLKRDTKRTCNVPHARLILHYILWR